MNDKDKELLKAALPQYVESITTRDARAGRDMYVCPLCGSGTGKGTGKADGAFSLYDDRKKWKCHSCQAGGDIFDLIKEHEGLEDFLDQAARAAEIAGITLDSPADPGRQLPTMTGENKPKTNQPPVRSGKFKDYITKCQAAAYQTGYFEQRGFNWDDIERFGLGYDANHNTIIIPYDKDGNYYLERNTTQPNVKEGRYIHKPSKEESGIEEPLYNRSALFSDLPAFITESPFDAISIMKAGNGKCNAIATGGVNHYKLLKTIKDTGANCIFILSFDYDEIGRNATEKLAANMESMNIPFITAEYSLTKYGEHFRKDPNDFLRNNPEQLAEDVAANIRRAELRKNKELFELMQMHQAQTGANNIQAFKDLVDGKPSEIAMNPVSTGFTELDKAIEGGLYPGLYILGAISSLGKTSFLLQMADQIAASGQDVLYISMEMSRNELIAKSISRLSYMTAGKNDKWKAKTVTGILSKDRYKDYGQAVKEHLKNCIDLYGEYAGKLYIYEGIGDIGAGEIKKIVKGHMMETGRPPVICVDYLQILSSFDVRASDKQATDRNVLELKRMSRDFKTPVFCLSSFNRDSYSTEVSMSAFKESGSIEFTSDCLMAIQPAGMKSGTDTSTQKINAELVKTCKAAKVREIELKILKQRNGQTGGSVKFNYHAYFNYFEEDKTQANRSYSYDKER